jgi:hypothetical protein
MKCARYRHATGSAARLAVLTLGAAADTAPQPTHPFPQICFECGAGFSTFKRRHHCRLCGQVFCSDCSDRAVSGEAVSMPRPSKESPGGGPDKDAAEVSLRACTFCHQQHQEPPNVHYALVRRIADQYQRASGAAEAVAATAAAAAVVAAAADAAAAEAAAADDAAAGAGAASAAPPVPAVGFCPASLPHPSSSPASSSGLAPADPYPINPDGRGGGCCGGGGGSSGGARPPPTSHPAQPPFRSPPPSPAAAAAAAAKAAVVASEAAAALAVCEARTHARLHRQVFKSFVLFDDPTVVAAQTAQAAATGGWDSGGGGNRVFGDDSGGGGRLASTSAASSSSSSAAAAAYQAAAYQAAAAAASGSGSKVPSVGRGGRGGRGYGSSGKRGAAHGHGGCAAGGFSTTSSAGAQTPRPAASLLPLSPGQQREADELRQRALQRQRQEQEAEQAAEGRQWQTHSLPPDAVIPARARAHLVALVQQTCADSPLLEPRRKGEWADMLLRLAARVACTVMPQVLWCVCQRVCVSLRCVFLKNARRRTHDHTHTYAHTHTHTHTHTRTHIRTHTHTHTHTSALHDSRRDGRRRFRWET